MKTFYCENEEKMREMGERLGAILSPGDVVCLTGDLGMGKTTLTKAMCAAQGADYTEVTSPTFSLCNIYKGKNCELRHFDLYRLNSEEELEDIGFEEALEEEGISFIEWCELFPEALPQEYLQVTITGKDTGREITLEGKGAHYQELCERVEAC